MTAGAIVAAGGSGKRVGAAKQFIDLGGKPMVRWSVDVLVPLCDPVVVVAPAADLELARRYCPDVHVVEGGPTRQSSVANGLGSINTDVVVIHDAARPFVTAELVQGVVGALENADGAIAALAVGDTLKESSDGFVTRTVARERLWAAQTPQAFWTDRLRAAHEKAAQGKIDLSDDAGLIEWAGGSVAIVPGDPLNIKVTTPGDLALATAIAAGSR